ncbi:MAG: biotin/lipoyl-binding protein [Gammaproteobacteria bacterium]
MTATDKQREEFMDAPVNRRRGLLLILLALGAGVAIFALLVMTKPDRPAVEARERVWQVAATTVSLQRRSPQLTLYGKVESPEVFKAAAPGQGRVAAVLASEGSRVKAGDPLVILDEKDFMPAVTQARADVAELEAQIESEKLRYASDKQALAEQQELLELARAELVRAENLEQRKLGSESALDQARQSVAQQQLSLTARELNVADHGARLARLEASLERARARLAVAERDYERSRITAPFDGIVSMLAVTVGNQVRDNDVVLEMYSLDRLEVRATVPVIYQQELISAAAEGNRYPATSGEIRLQLDRLSGQAGTAGIDALFSIGTGSEKLRLGQQLTIQLMRPEQPDLAMLPFQALYGNDRIYRIDAENRLETLVIEQVGTILDGGVEKLLVRSDELSDGDRIVSTHLPNAVQGLKVSVVE